jgi:hypothetical protein
MPKNFEKMNYYEMLDIGPGAAAFEIRHAYNAARQIYTCGSLVSYSFFSEEERQRILSLIEEAYETLINEQTRKQYHEELVRRGELGAGTDEAVQKKPVGVFDLKRGPGQTMIMPGRDVLKEKVARSETIGTILQKEDICGADLRRIRQELGVELEHIAQMSKIRVDYLKHIEEDAIGSVLAPVFLKGFLKSYLNCLCLEPVEEISARYLEALARPGGG